MESFELRGYVDLIDSFADVFNFYKEEIGLGIGGSVIAALGFQSLQFVFLIKKLNGNTYEKDMIDEKVDLLADMLPRWNRMKNFCEDRLSI